MSDLPLNNRVLAKGFGRRIDNQIHAAIQRGALTLSDVQDAIQMGSQGADKGEDALIKALRSGKLSGKTFSHLWGKEPSTYDPTKLYKTIDDEIESVVNPQMLKDKGVQKAVADMLRNQDIPETLTDTRTGQSWNVVGHPTIDYTRKLEGKPVIHDGRQTAKWKQFATKMRSTFGDRLDTPGEAEEIFEKTIKTLDARVKASKPGTPEFIANIKSRSNGIRALMKMPSYVASNPEVFSKKGVREVLLRQAEYDLGTTKAQILGQVDEVGKPLERATSYTRKTVTKTQIREWMRKTMNLSPREIDDLLPQYVSYLKDMQDGIKKQSPMKALRNGYAMFEVASGREGSAKAQVFHSMDIDKQGRLAPETISGPEPPTVREDPGKRAIAKSLKEQHLQNVQNLRRSGPPRSWAPGLSKAAKSALKIIL